MWYLPYLCLDSCHPFFPSVQNLYRSLSERSQSSWLLTWWQRLWIYQKSPSSIITTGWTSDDYHCFYPKPLGSGGGVAKHLKLDIGILVLVCQELVLKYFCLKHLYQREKVITLANERQLLLVNTQFLERPGHLRGTWVRRILLEWADLLLRASFSRKADITALPARLKTLLLWMMTLVMIIMHGDHDHQGDGDDVDHHHLTH